MNQVIAVEQVCEKYLANGNDIFSAFMDIKNMKRLIDEVCGSVDASVWSCRTKIFESGT